MLDDVSKSGFLYFSVQKKICRAFFFNMWVKIRRYRAERKKVRRCDPSPSTLNSTFTDRSLCSR